MVVFSTLTLTFLLLIGANYSASCKKAAGYVGMFCGGSAIYTAIAMLYRVSAGKQTAGVPQLMAVRVRSTEYVSPGVVCHTKRDS